MKASRVWLGLFLMAFGVLFANLMVTLSTQPAHGDMTRIAKISEREFGWRSTPPPIAMADIVNAPIQDADVLIIGDSYSMFFAWQSVLVKAGYRVATTHWDNIDAICDDFGPWLRRSGFAGKLVLFESVERVMPQRISNAQACKAMRRPFTAVPIPPSSPSAAAPDFKVNWNGTVFSGLEVWRNTQRIRYMGKNDVVFNVPRYGDSVFAANVPDGCAQFSNRMCEHGLFLMHDRQFRELTIDDAEFLAQIRDRAAPTKMLWMVIPNKTSVYLDAEHAKQFERRANELAIGPDLFSMARVARREVVDLYWPNDTHWSMQGQLYFGQQMLKVVQSAIGAPNRNARAS
ncbi:hypothetical protein [Variovorax sp. PAMC 28711]|uniref:hypothetical protein n=1 Tax=Variovorax sp. PAMC 28711 TaxID=1795631 RepID=UPI00078DE5D7|nr:hypothetical protein [Variovorax sp. PAMC 28711]AMM23822.1 hypothetical protein AX767_05275 [Variovorax sp. PAMC 28711]